MLLLMLLDRLADWHLPGGPVGPVSRWAATSNVKVGHTSSSSSSSSSSL